MTKYKISLVGNFAVGKTSVVSRFVRNTFNKDYLTTIGVKVDTKIVNYEKEPEQLIIWDIAGRENYNNIEYTYLRGSTGILLVCDGTRANTLRAAINLKQSIDERFGKLPCVLVINKSDLETTWQITSEDMQKLKNDGFDVFIVSAKSEDNQTVENAFLTLYKKIKSVY